MSTVYVDTSALVKRYLFERGSGWISDLCEREMVSTSYITVSEVASTLARRTREGALTSLERDTLFQTFLGDCRSFALTRVDQALSRQAAALILAAPGDFRLRGMDALHLASAVSVFARAGQRGFDPCLFVAADRSLLAAAEWAGMDTANPDEHP